MLDKVKVTISQEDGGPLFDWDDSPMVQDLTEAAPVMVIVRDGGAILTMQGDQQSAVDFIKGLTLPD